MPLRTLLIGLFVSLSLMACSDKTTLTTHYIPAQQQAAPKQFMAGAATVDITPPPGVLPRAGYATWSTVGDGFRTRLYARAYYLKDSEGDSHVIIQTDLATGSRILLTKLGELLAKHSDIDTSRLTITSTHTHSGPGQIVGSAFYNKHISHKAGFASAYFDFLIERLSGAVMAAYNTQSPAKLATGRIDVWGQTRNRSMEAHVENHTVSNKSTADNRTFHRINPGLYMVRIDSLTGENRYQPLGAFASFAIHGTAVPERETLFNADVFAYINKDWQWFVEQHYQPDQAVHISAFEGTHGDVAPANRFGMLGYIEARRVGQNIAKKAIELYQSLDDQLTDQVDIHSAMQYVNLREENRINEIEICQDAAAGMTLAAGPREHSSPVIGELPFFEQGSRRMGEETDNCQGRKRHLGFKYLQPLLEPKDSFPDFVLLQLVQINDMLIAPMPFEFTTESGYRTEQAIRQAYIDAGQTIEHVMISSLANGYTGYVTTPEEYNRQYYEGGHTIYGKNTQPYLAAHMAELTRKMLSRERYVNIPDSIDYQLYTRRFLPEEQTAQGQRSVLNKPEYHHARTNREGFWRFAWKDINISQIQMHEPLVHVETRLNKGPWQGFSHNGNPIDDDGYDVAVRVLDETDEQGMNSYQAEWYNPLFEGEQREFRFVIAPRGTHKTLYSPPFN